MKELIPRAEHDPGDRITDYNAPPGSTAERKNDTRVGIKPVVFSKPVRQGWQRRATFDAWIIVPVELHGLRRPAVVSLREGGASVE